MSKMFFHSPMINPLDLDDGDEPIVIGGGSAISVASPVSFTNWLEAANSNPELYDYNHDNALTQYDYYQWWTANHFTQEQWESANPGMPFGDGTNP